MHLSDKFCKTSQHWFAAEIFVESRARAATVAQIERTDKYHQCKYHTYQVQRDRGCVQQQ